MSSTKKSFKKGQKCIFFAPGDPNYKKGLSGQLCEVSRVDGGNNYTLRLESGSNAGYRFGATVDLMFRPEEFASNFTGVVVVLKNKLLLQRQQWEEYLAMTDSTVILPEVDRYNLELLNGENPDTSLDESTRIKLAQYQMALESAELQLLYLRELVEKAFEAINNPNLLPNINPYLFIEEVAGGESLLSPEDTMNPIETISEASPFAIPPSFSGTKIATRKKVVPTKKKTRSQKLTDQLKEQVDKALEEQYKDIVAEKGSMQDLYEELHKIRNRSQEEAFKSVYGSDRIVTHDGNSYVVANTSGSIAIDMDNDWGVDPNATIKVVDEENKTVKINEV
jgi:hypothetical protein